MRDLHTCYVKTTATLETGAVCYRPQTAPRSRSDGERAAPRRRPRAAPGTATQRRPIPSGAGPDGTHRELGRGLGRRRPAARGSGGRAARHGGERSKPSRLRQPPTPEPERGRLRPARISPHRHFRRLSRNPGGLHALWSAPRGPPAPARLRGAGPPGWPGAGWTPPRCSVLVRSARPPQTACFRRDACSSSLVAVATSPPPRPLAIVHLPLRSSNTGAAVASAPVPSCTSSRSPRVQLCISTLSLGRRLLQEPPLLTPRSSGKKSAFTLHAPIA